jgi:hypothetical protein
MGKLTWPLAVFALLCAGCGTDPKVLKNAGEDKGKQKPKLCSGNLEPFHQLTLILKNPIPVKLALEINGRRELDECRAPDQAPPAVLGERDGKKFTFTVMHAGAYPQPPASISFRLLDLGDCTGDESVVFGGNNLPLQFVTDYPNGTSCPGRTFAARQVFQP